AVVGVPQTAEDEGVFDVAAAETHQHLVVDARRVEEARVITGTRRAQPCPDLRVQRRDAHLHLGLPGEVDVTHHDTLQDAVRQAFAALLLALFRPGFIQGDGHDPASSSLCAVSTPAPSPPAGRGWRGVAATEWGSALRALPSPPTPLRPALRAVHLPPCKGEESPSAARAGGGSALRALPSLPNPLRPALRAVHLPLARGREARAQRGQVGVLPSGHCRPVQPPPPTPP